MLAEKERDFQPQLVSLETLVPEDNFYRRLDAKLDLSFVRDLVRQHYKPFGRPSIDPVVFFKLQLIMFFEGIRSERQLVKSVAMRLDHRWYLGYDLLESVPDHSSLSKIRDRYGLEVFQKFFDKIVDLCAESGLIWGQELLFDGTMVRANADFNRQVPRFYHQAQQHLQDLFEEQGTTQLVQKYDGTRQPGQRATYKRLADFWCSSVDQTATSLGHKRLGYHLHYAVDGGKARIILHCLVTPASIQDNQPMLDVAWRTRFRWQLPLKKVIADRRYGTIENVVGIESNRIQACMPLHSQAARSRQRPNVFPSDLFHFDAEHNRYICPQGQFLKYFNTDYQAQRLNYKAKDRVCAVCLVRSQCTTSKQGRRVSHSMHKHHLDQVQAYQDTFAYHKAMRKRQVWVEPKFAELKVWHLGSKYRLRGLRKVNIEALLKAAGQNIKQLLKAKNRKSSPIPPTNSMLIQRLVPFISMFWAFDYKSTQLKPIFVMIRNVFFNALDPFSARINFGNTDHLV
ncbi:MAG: transposase [Anaerolineaceae bacterium]|nr:transposase [Anaerolineaceae bacterium]